LAKNEVVKHSAVIHISNRITLFQRRAWNILLANAFNDLENPSVHVFKIPFIELCERLGYRHTDKKYKEVGVALERLVDYSVRWNILRKDGKEKRGSASLLAGFEIEDGMCYYDYSAILRDKLSNPSIYARINLTIQNRFNSKHALALYETFVDYQRIGQTPWISLKDFRELMGLDNNKYVLFKDLNKWVISTALKEINRESDLQINLEKKKERRRITELKFIIRKNPKYQPALEFDPFPSEVEIKELEDLSTNVNQELMDRLVNFGVPIGKAKLELKNDEQRVRMALDAAISYIEKQGDNIYNIAGVVNRAITDGWGQKSPVEIENEEKKKAQVQAKTKKEKAERELEEKQRIFGEERKDEAFRIFNAMSEQEKEGVLTEVEKRVSPFLRKSYNEKGIHSPMVMMSVFIPYLSKVYFPEELQEFDKWMDR
jgi:hypothetical protein